MKKRILSLAMAACLALSMMLTLSACGKKNLDAGAAACVWAAAAVSVPGAAVYLSHDASRSISTAFTFSPGKFF